MISIDTLLTPLSQEQMYDQLLGVLETLGVPARSWRRAGKLSTILHVIAGVLSTFSIYIAAVIASGFLDTATGTGLTLLARHVFGVTRRPASFATGNVRFTNTGAGSFAAIDYPAGSVRVYSPTSSKAYTNAEALSLAPFETKLVSVIAVEEGSTSSAPASTITALETTLLDVTVINPDAVVGRDEESDDELKAKCRAKLASLSLRGPRGAYEYAVLTATRTDGSAVDINRHSVSESSSTGVVTVYVAAPSGAPIPSDLTAIEDSIEAHARPDSVTVNVLAVTEVTYTRTYTVWARRTPGLDAAAITAACQAKLLTLETSYDIGGLKKPPSTQGYLFTDGVAATIQSAHPAIFDVDVNDASDMPLSPGQVVAFDVTINPRFS